MSCETGRVIYVSDSVTPVLNQAQSDWLGSSLYDQLHPDDTEKLREQLSTSENNNGGKKRLDFFHLFISCQSSLVSIVLHFSDFRSDVGHENRHGEERGWSDICEDEYGCTSLVHLQDEVMHREN